jgi:hypothetical protein
MNANGIMKLLCAYFKNVLDSVAKNGKRKLFKMKLEILNDIINAPKLVPIMKKEVTPTFPMYSGSRNRKGTPNFLAIDSVINAKSNNQYNIII